MEDETPQSINPAYFPAMEYMLSCVHEVARVCVDAIKERQLYVKEVDTQQEYGVLIFELNCLCYYLVDHEIRRSVTEEFVINTLYSELARRLFGILQTPYSDEQQGFIYSWRLGRYHDVTLGVDQDETYGIYQSIKVNDYFYQLADQLVKCLIHDRDAGDSNGIFVGIVKEDIKVEDWRRFHGYVQRIMELLLECALGLFLAAKLWAEGGPAYTKTVEELKASYELAQEQARADLEKRQAGKKLLSDQAWWDSAYRQGQRFRDVTPPVMEQGTIGEPLRRLEPSESGYPLRWQLLRCYDLRYGIVAQDFETKEDRFLSMGMLTSLLRRGEASAHGFPNPDLSDQNAVQVAPIPPWDLPSAARALIEQAFAGLNAPFKASQVVDPEGTTIIAVSHVLWPELRHRIEWAISPGTVMYLEAEPVLAKFDIWDIGEAGDFPVVQLQYPELSEEDLGWWHARMEEGLLLKLTPNRFINPINELYYGFTVVEDEDEGRPLQEWLLGCYDSTAGIVLYDPTEAHEPFTLLLGDVIDLLRDGKLADPDDSVPEEQEWVLIEGAAPDFPDPFLLPRAAYRTIGWTLKSAGVPVPMTAMIETTRGAAVVFNIDEIEEETHQRWAYLRIIRSLPRKTLMLPQEWSRLARFQIDF